MEKQGKDLSVLRIDPSRKGSFDSKGKAPWSPLIYVGAGVLLVLIVVAGASGFLTSAPEVEVQRVGLERLTGGATGGSVVLTAGGYIVAHHTIQVSSKIIGRVAWVGIEKGDQVQEGQVLVRLEDAEYQAQLSQARASLEVARARLQELERGSRPQEVDASRASAAEAEATFNNAAVNLKRVENLAKNDVASQQQLDNARTQYEVAKAQLESARKRFDLVKIGPREEQIAYARAQAAQAQAAVDYAQTMQNSTLIRAPVSGTVLERSIEKGELVTTMNFGGTGGVKASVCSLADLKDLQVELDINQNDFPRISPRQECQVTADAYPDRTYKGVVEEIAPQANRQKATIQVKVKIQEPDSFLRPEMNAHVSFFASAQENKKSAESSRETLVIPRSAIVQSDGKPAVFVLDGSRVQLRQIEVGREIGERAEVADGLGPNDRIVTKGLEGLSTGQRVRVKQGS